jgi:hypothetical protein
MSPAPAPPAGGTVTVRAATFGRVAEPEPTACETSASGGDDSWYANGGVAPKGRMYTAGHVAERVLII